MSNYEKNKNKVIDDYYKLLGTFYNCKLVYEDIFSLAVYDEEALKIKIGREEDLLSELGKVGEKLFKYILGLEYLNINPNCDESSFEVFFRKNSVVKEFIKKHGISETDERLIAILNYDDPNNQKAHNYDYWFSVMELAMPGFFKKLQKFLVYLENSDIFINYCVKYDRFFDPYAIYREFMDGFSRDGIFVSDEFTLAVFPDYGSCTEYVSKLSDKQIQMLLETNREAIRKSGDAFTRFRYASNNLDNREISVEDTYGIISKLVIFATMLHDNNDDLCFDLNMAYTKYKALEYCKYVDFDEEEIKRKFDLNLGYSAYLTLLFDRNYSSFELEKILYLGIPRGQLWKVTGLNISARDIEYSRTLGVSDIDEIYRMKQKYIEDGTVFKKMLTK